MGDSLILNHQRTQRLPKRLCPIKNLMVDVFELTSQSPKDPTLPPLGHTWEDQLTADRPLLSIEAAVPDGSIAHVPVLTHHVAIDSFLQSGPMSFCKKVKELLK